MLVCLSVVGLGAGVRVYVGCIMRIMTVIMNAIPRAMAASLRRFLFRAMFPSWPVDDVSSSDVMSVIMAVMASHRLMSDVESGKCISFWFLLVSLFLGLMMLLLCLFPGYSLAPLS